MGKRKLKTVFWVFLLLIVTGLIGCKQKEPEKEQLCHIVMEKGDGYQVTDPVRTIKSGSNVSFTVTLDNNWQILGTDYHGETEIIKDDDGKTVAACDLLVPGVGAFRLKKENMRFCMMPMADKTLQGIQTE